MTDKDLLAGVTPEAQRIGRIFKDHIEKAIDELGPGYIVDLQGNFESQPVRITIEISSEKRLEAKINHSESYKSKESTSGIE